MTWRNPNEIRVCFFPTCPLDLLVVCYLAATSVFILEINPVIRLRSIDGPSDLI
jgi:hypothetical protein